MLAAFQAVQTAYETLSDENKKRMYDQYGDEGGDRDSLHGVGGLRQ